MNRFIASVKDLVNFDNFANDPDNYKITFWPVLRPAGI